LFNAHKRGLMYRNSSYCTWKSHKWPNFEIFSPHYVADATVELTYLLGFTIMHFYEALPPETPHLPWNLPCSLSACAPPHSTKTNKTNRFSLSVWPMDPQGFAPWPGASDSPRWRNLDALDMHILIRRRDAGVLGGAPLASKWP
jgi:hypothetical protein